jgi:hypothetical protein
MVYNPKLRKYFIEFLVCFPTHIALGILGITDVKVSSDGQNEGW